MDFIAAFARQCARKTHLVLNDSELSQLSDLSPGRVECTAGKPFPFMYVVQKTSLFIICFREAIKM